MFLTMDRSPIADRIEALMREQGLNKAEISRRSGVSRVYLTDLFKGKSREPRRSNIVKIAKALGAPIEFFYKDEEINGDEHPFVKGMPLSNDDNHLRHSLVASRLDQKRLEKGLSHRALAMKSGVNHTYLKNLLEGKSQEPRRSKVEALAKVLETPIEFFYAYEESQGADSAPGISREFNENENSLLIHEIQHRMKEQGMDQKELALSAGLNETYVRDILQGKSKRPDVFSIRRLAETLGCSIEDLVGVSCADDLQRRESVHGSKSGSKALYSSEEVAVIGLWRALLPDQKNHFLGLLEAVADRKTA